MPLSYVDQLFKKCSVFVSKRLSDGCQVDPTLTRADRLVGQVLGEVGALPDVFTELEINFFLLRRLLGVRTQVSHSSPALTAETHTNVSYYVLNRTRGQYMTSFGPAVVRPDASCLQCLQSHLSIACWTPKAMSQLQLKKLHGLISMHPFGLLMLAGLTDVHWWCRVGRSRARCRSSAKGRFSC